MKESKFNKLAMDHLAKTCSDAVIYKHADRFTSGIPDSSVTWAGPTTWLEFKDLEPTESIHKQLKPLQLVELLKLERASHRAWVVALRYGKRGQPDRTILYRPTALARRPTNPEPVPVLPLGFICQPENILRDLRTFGVVEYEGHAYEAITKLVLQSHGDLS